MEVWSGIYIYLVIKKPPFTAANRYAEQLHYTYFPDESELKMKFILQLEQLILNLLKLAAQQAHDGAKLRFSSDNA